MRIAHYISELYASIFNLGILIMLLKQIFVTLVLSSLLATSTRIAATFTFTNHTNKTVFVTVQHDDCYNICGKIFHPSYTNLCCTSFFVDSNKTHNDLLSVKGGYYASGYTFYVYDGEEGDLLAQKYENPCTSNDIQITLDSNNQLNGKCA